MTAPPPIPPSIWKSQTPVVLEPNFFGALRGLWSFTWKSQLTWRRSPGLIISLLAIPLLTFFTVDPPKSAPGAFDWQQPPRQQVAELRRSLRREGSNLDKRQGNQLVEAIQEESANVQPLKGVGDGQGQFTEQMASQQAEQIQAYYDRVGKRAETILNADQLTVFQKVQAAKLQRSLERASGFPQHETKPYFRWLVDVYFLIFLPLFCLAVCGAMIRDELQADTLGFLVTRPLTRARLFVLKYLCHMTWLQIVIAVHCVLLFAVGNLRQVPGVNALFPLFFGVEILAVLAWSALSSLLGLINQKYMVLGLVYGFVVEMGIGRIPTNINSLSLTRHIKAILANSDTITQMYEWSSQGTLFSIGMMFLATVLFAGLAAALFTFREYHHAEEMQK
jgi:ABC-type transport system involved in multi-copper enzyme maturation permease subunit